MGATCVPQGGSEYYQELLTDGWLDEGDGRRFVDLPWESEDGLLIWVL